MNKKLLTTIGVAFLLTLGLRAQAPPQAPAADQGPSAKEKFKNIKVLTMPASQLRDTMEYFTAALGTNCALCHVVGPNGDFAADDKRPKDTARKMIQMVDAFNANPDKLVTLTCATCHHGKELAERTPPLAVEMTPAEAAAAAQRAAQFAARGGPGGPGGPGGQPGAQPGGGQPGGGQPGGAQPGGPARGAGPGGAPGAAPGAPGQPGRGGPPRPTESLDDVLNKFVQAIGGPDAVAKAKTLVFHGTQTTRDLVTSPLTVEEKATGEYRVQVDTKPNPQTRVFDGKSSWVQAGQNARDLEGIQAAQVARSSELLLLNLKQRYPNLQVGRYGNVDGVDTIILQARTPAVSDQFQFERQSGLLKRRTIQTPTPYGALVEQVDYSDYKDVDGVKLPFQVKYTSWSAVTTQKIADAKLNAAVSDADFAKK